MGANFGISHIWCKDNQHYKLGHAINQPEQEASIVLTTTYTVQMTTCVSMLCACVCINLLAIRTQMQKGPKAHANMEELAFAGFVSTIICFS